MARLVVVYAGYLGRGGGVVQHLRQVTRFFAGAGYATEVLSLDSLPRGARLLPHVVQRALNRLRPPLGTHVRYRVGRALFRPRVQRLVAGGDVAAVLFEDIYTAFDPGVPSLAVLHALETHNLQGMAVSPAHVRRARLAEAACLQAIPFPIAVVSAGYGEAVARDLAEVGAACPPLTMVPLGIETRAFPDPPAVRAAGTLQLVFLGFLVPRKNLGFLPELAAAVRDRMDFRLTVVGDGRERATLAAAFDARGLDPWIRWRGQVRHDDVPTLLQHFHVMVHPATVESFGYGLLEGRLAGLRTLTIPGLAVPPEFCDVTLPLDAVAWAEHLVAHRPAYMAPLSAERLAGIRALRTRYSVERMCVDYARLLDLRTRPAAPAPATEATAIPGRGGDRRPMEIGTRGAPRLSRGAERGGGWGALRGPPCPMKRVMVVFGTRPEVIKLGPVVQQLRRHDPAFDVVTVTTGQHREMLAQALACFDLVPDVSLDLMQENQDLFAITTRALDALAGVLDRVRPRAVLVQGDTTTAFCAALAAYYCRIPVGHVEAGLRTRDRLNPYPEEANRQMVGVLAEWHFAPTAAARDNLLAEAVPPERIVVTGNTVIDALAMLLPRARGSLPSLPALAPGRLLLVTCHRRESFGRHLTRICVALRRIVEKNPDVSVVYPVHPNPHVQETVRAVLAGHERVHLIAPLDYLEFLALMERAYLVLSDSGGVQEEAPSLGKPVLVLRRTTERPEGVAAGVARLVGTDPDVIVAETQVLLDDPAAYGAMSRAVNPYGDGHAAERIVALLHDRLRV